MTAVDQLIEKGLMAGIEEDIPLLYTNPDGIILQEVPITGKTITTIEVAGGSSDLEVHPDLLPGGPEYG